MKVLMRAFFSDNGYTKDTGAIKNDRLSNAEKDKGKSVLSFTLTLVIKKPIHLTVAIIRF